MALLLFANAFYAQAPDTWTQKATMPPLAAARDRAIGFSINGKGYFGLGWDSNGNYYRSLWEYDPATDVWTQKADLPGAYAARSRAFTFVLNGKAYIGTGTDGNVFLVAVLEYDPVTDVWTPKANFAGGARYGAAAFVIGNKGYVTGGYNNTVLNDHWEYNPVGDTWTAKANIPLGRYSAVAFTIGAAGYVGTGWNGNYLDDFWKYIPATDAWVAAPSLPSSIRALSTAFSIGPRGFVVGGSNATPAALADVWEFNLFTDSWIQKGNFSGGGRWGASSFVVGNKAYVGMGNNDPTSPANNAFKDLWEYTPTPLNTNTFQKSYGGTSDDTDPDRVCFGTTTSDGGYVIASTTQSFSPNKDIYLIRCNKFGDTLWTKTIGTVNQDIASSIRQTSDGGYIIAGMTGASYNDCDALIAKTTANGVPQWITSAPGPGVQRANYAEQLPNGDYIVTGKIDNAAQNAGLIKLNAGGGTVNNRTINRSSGTNALEGYWIQQAKNGGYAVSGEFTTAGNLDALLIVSNAALSSFSVTNYGSTGTFSEERTFMTENPDGTFIFCGTSNLSAGHGGKDFFLTKTNSTGSSVIWTVYYGGASDDVARGIARTSDGGYVITGFTKSIGSGGEDAFLMKVNSLGLPLWTRAYGGTQDDKANSISLAPDGGFALFGETRSFSAGGTDVYFIKTDSLGISGCNEVLQNFPTPITSPLLTPGTGGSSAGPFSLSGGPSLVSNLSPSTQNNVCNSCTFPLTKGKTNAACFGSSTGTAFVNPNSGTAPYTFSWSNGATTSAISGLLAGTYSVNVTDANSCSASDTIKITQPPAITINFPNDTINICLGNSSTLSATVSGGAPSYSYLWNPSTGLSCTTCVSPVSNTTMSISYALEVTDSSSCVEIDTVRVEVHSIPVAQAGSDQSICASSPVTLGTTPASGVNYSWSPALGLNNSTLANPVASPIVTTTYILTASNALNCSSSDTVIVNVIASPTVSISSSTPKTICQGSGSVLNANSNATSYLWSTGATSTSISISPSSPTIFTVTVTIGSCSDTGSITINVVPTPTVSITSTGSSNTICAGSTVVLSGSGIGSYLWSTGATATSISVSYTTTGIYVNTLTVTAGGNTSCYDTDTLTLFVVSSPVINVTASSYTLCTGISSDTLFATEIPGANYSWSPGVHPNNDTIVIGPGLTAGNHTYTVSVSNGGGCAGTATVSINVSPGFTTPVVTPNPGNYCLGEPLLPFTASAVTSLASTGWTDLAGNLLLLGPAFTPTVSAVNSYTFLCIQGSDKYCLSNPAIVVLNINDLPTANAGSDITICPDHTAQLQASGGINYFWSPDTALSATNVFNPSANLDSTYSYQVMVTDANGCTDIDSITVYISVNDSCGIYVYNVLTPNSDGNNDGWWIDGIALYPDNRVTIFNRWGTIVWDRMGYDNKKNIWRGDNDQGQSLPAGTYYYVIQVKGKRYSKWVELVK